MGRLNDEAFGPEPGLIDEVEPNVAPVRERVLAREQSLFDRATRSEEPEPFVPTGAQELTGAQRKFQGSLTKQLKRVEIAAARVGEEIPEPKHEGFWWLLDKLDRPRNAVHNAIYRWQAGERDLAAVGQNLKQGLTADERADFEMIMDELAPDMDLSFRIPFIGLGVDNNTARAMIGLGGDTLLDPANLIPGGVIKNIISKGVGAPLKAVGRVTKLDEVVKGAFNRSTGIPQLDTLLDQEIDAKHALSSNLLDEAGEIANFIRPLRQNHKGIVAKLAEETNVDRVFRFAERARKGLADPDALETLLSDFRTFHNPKAVRELIGIQDDDTFEIVRSGTQRLGTFQTRLKNLREASGIKVSTLDAQLQSKAKEIEAKILRVERQIMREAADEALRTVEFSEGTVKAQKDLLREMLGKKKMDQVVGIMQKMRHTATDPRKTLDPNEVLGRYLEEIQPGFVAGLTKITKDEAAAPAFWDEFMRNSMLMRNDNKQLEKLRARHDTIVQNLAFMPSYVHHILSTEALDQMSKKAGSSKNFLYQLRTPKTASDLTRRFHEKGRPLSFEEVEDVLARGDARGISGITGPIRSTTAMDRLMQRPGKAAEFFTTDEFTILESGARQTAQSVSVADYLREADRIFGRGEAQPGFRRLEELEEGRKLVAMMPELKGRFYDEDVLVQLARSTDRFVNPDAAGKVLRTFDAMQNWWISFTLPLYPAFHTRNAIGNLFNMVDAGFASNPGNPFEFAADIAAWQKSSAVQMMASRNNIEGLKKQKFFLKSIGEERTGDELIQLALRNGVINSGWFGGQIGEAMGAFVDPVWRKGANYIPKPSNAFGLDPKKNPAVQIGRNTGQMVENNARLTLFVSRLQKGDSVSQAAATVKKFLGDYRGEVMTDFERQVMNRVFPFYRWMRFNVPLQFEQMLLSRGKRARTLALLRGQDLGQDLVQELTGGAPVDVRAEDLPAEIPDWIEEAAGVPVRRDPSTGELQFFMLENFIPAADIDNFIPLNPRETLRFGTNMMSPFVTRPLELAQGRSFFLDRDLTKEASGEFLGQEMNAELINQLRTLRFLSELDRLDPFGTFHRVRPQISNEERVLRSLGLLPIQRVNEARAKLNYDAERLERMRKQMNAWKRFQAIENAEEESGGSNSARRAPTGDESETVR